MVVRRILLIVGAFALCVAVLGGLAIARDRQGRPEAAFSDASNTTGQKATATSGTPGRGAATGKTTATAPVRQTATDSGQPTSSSKTPGKKLSMEDLTAHLRRNMDRTIAQEAAAREAAAANGTPLPASPAVATSPEQASPETPWPPRHLPAQRIEKSMLTPNPRPRKTRKPHGDDGKRPSTQTVPTTTSSG